MSNENLLRILELGSGGGAIASKTFEGVEIDVTRDPGTDDPLPAEWHDQFDIVYIEHLLEYLPRQKVLDKLVDARKMVKEGGEVWVITPSLEWAAEEIHKGNSGLAVQIGLYGMQTLPDEYFKSGFTMTNMRELLSLAKLIPRKVHQSTGTLEFEGYGKVEILRNIAIGMKYTVEVKDGSI